jgi:hypothetical protein
MDICFTIAMIGRDFARRAMDVGDAPPQRTAKLRANQKLVETASARHDHDLNEDSSDAETITDRSTDLGYDSSDEDEVFSPGGGASRGAKRRKGPSHTLRKHQPSGSTGHEAMPEPQQ